MGKRKKIIIVTGASGFVGRALVERLLQEQDIHVRCLVRPDSDRTYLNALDGDISFCAGDIMQPHTLANAMHGAWGVVNLAGYREFWARDREHFYALNRDGAQHVFRACLAADVAKVVQVSTPLAYGVPAELPFDEESAPGKHPSDYARSKYLGDLAGWQLHDSDDLPLSIVYLAAVIGAGDDKETMEVRRAVEKRMPALVGADTTYTYVYLRDAAEAIARALLQDNTVGRRYLIGNQRAPKQLVPPSAIRHPAHVAAHRTHCVDCHRCCRHLERWASRRVLHRRVARPTVHGPGRVQRGSLDGTEVQGHFE